MDAKKKGFFSRTWGLFFGKKQEPVSLVGNGFSSFDAANNSHERGHLNTYYPTDSKTELDDTTLFELKRKGRDLEKNSGLARGILRDFKVYGIGKGIFPNPKTYDSKWNKEASDFFFRWSKKCETTNRWSWRVVQSMIIRNMLVDGEVFVVKTYDENGIPKLQILESHRLAYSFFEPTKNLANGIEFDKKMRPIAYHFGVGFNGEKATRVKANAVLHIFDPDRISQVRGYPHIQHSYNDIKDKSEILGFEKKKVKLNSAVAYTVSDSVNMGESDFLSEEDGDEGASVKEIGKAVGGTVVKLASGEKLEAHTPNIPSSTLMGFVDVLDRASCLGILPPEFANDPSKIGGASVRLITSKTQRYIDDVIYTLDESLNDAVWFFVVGWAIDNKLLRPVKWWWYSTWTHPKKLTVDAGRDAQQNRADIEFGVRTFEEDFQERGKDFEDEIETRINNIKYMMKKAEEAGVPFDLVYRPSGTQTIQQKGEGKEDE